MWLKSIYNCIAFLVLSTDSQNLVISEEFTTFSLHKASLNRIQIFLLCITQEIFRVNLSYFKIYIVLLVNNHHWSSTRCEQFRSNIQVDLLGFIGYLHTSPPQLAIIQLEEQYSVTYVEIGHFLIFISLTNNLSNKVDSLIHLQTNLCFNTQLTVFIGSPTV